MAFTQIDAGNPQAVMKWQRSLALEIPKGMDIAPLIGDSEDSIIQEKKELKDGGDTVRFFLEMQLRGRGTGSTQTLVGNEEQLSRYYDQIKVDELNHNVGVPGQNTIDQQRILDNLRTRCRGRLSEWYADRTSLSFFLQMAGYTSDTITWRGRETALDPLYTGNNAVLAPSDDRHILAENQTSEESLAAGEKMTLALLTIAKEKARTANPRIRPVRINGADKYVVYLHPYQITDLKLSANATTGVSWPEIQLAAMRGGEITKNPLYTGALGEYDGMILRESEDVPTGVHSSTGAEVPAVRRAIFLGAQAAAIAYSSKNSKNSPYKWVEEMQDYKRKLGVSVQSIVGLKKIRFDEQDFGAMVISTRAEAHS
jgi:N4-gp56 family major capsid protein